MPWWPFKHVFGHSHCRRVPTTSALPGNGKGVLRNNRGELSSRGNTQRPQTTPCLPSHCPPLPSRRKRTLGGRTGNGQEGHETVRAKKRQELHRFGSRCLSVATTSAEPTNRLKLATKDARKPLDGQPRSPEGLRPLQVERRLRNARETVATLLNSSQTTGSFPSSCSLPLPRGEGGFPLKKVK